MGHEHISLSLSATAMVIGIVCSQKSIRHLRCSTLTDIENACNGWALDIEYFKRLTYPCRWNRVNKKGSIFRENIRSSATDPPKTRCSGFPKASEETFKIIKSIDEIAFQTNLLALNAAVEAAQAEELNSVVAELVAMIGGTDAVSSTRDHHPVSRIRPAGQIRQAPRKRPAITGKAGMGKALPARRANNVNHGKMIRLD